MKIVNGKMYFTKKEVADMVERTPLTIHNYDAWSNEREEQGQERFIPKPIIMGHYRYWTQEDVEKIREFVNWIENNRGAMAKYSRRIWCKKDRLAYRESKRN